MVTVQGKNGISATVIADSINGFGNRMTTFELVYPRFILSEVNTHRMLSKNSASSRAIPLAKMIELVQSQPADPVWWGKNQPGMQAKEELQEYEKTRARNLWESAKEAAVHYLKEMESIGLHKQIACRITEPWFMMKTIMSGTEFANLYHLRYHKDAQPEFKELGRVMHEAQALSTPSTLFYGDWHLPYITKKYEEDKIRYFSTESEVTLEEAQQISISCCAQVSYRKRDESLEKAKDIFEKLSKAEILHASPFEHVAMPMSYVKLGKAEYIEDLPAGVSHVDRDRYLWSGNLKGFIQYRKLMANEAVW